MFHRHPNSSQPPLRSGFTLVELLVVIGIIALLVSILLPSLTRARQTASQVSCQSNLRQIGAALLFYNNQYKKLPSVWGERQDSNGYTGINLLYVDGHVESKAIGDLTRCALCITVK